LACVLCAAGIETGLRLRFPWTCVGLEALRNSLPSRKQFAVEAASYEAALREYKGGGIVLVGGSDLREGVDTILLKELLGGKEVRVFGMTGQDPLDTLDQNDYFTDRRPDLLIVMSCREGFYRGYMPRRLKYFLGVKGLRVLLETAHPRELFKMRKDMLDGLLGAVVFSLRYRETIRESLYARWGFRPRGSKEHGKGTAREDCWLHPLLEAQKAAFEREALEMQRRGVPLMVVESPRRSDVLSGYPAEVSADYRAFSERMSHDHGLRWIAQEEMPAFNEKDFGDPRHLSERGCEKFTRYLGSILMGSSFRRTSESRSLLDSGFRRGDGE